MESLLDESQHAGHLVPITYNIKLGKRLSIFIKMRDYQKVSGLGSGVE